jgi:glucosamine-6-phosphate deaminase
MKNLDVRVHENRKIMGQHAAEMVSQKVEELLAEKPNVNMLFASAPSQNEFLFCLSEKENIDWEKVNAFHLDEYLGLPENTKQGFGNYLKERLFAKLPFRSVNYICGNPSNFQEECERYSALLKIHPIDIACMGIGENGHIAFNDPPADFNDSCLVKRVKLDEICRQQQVNEGCFNTIAEVPEYALTLTVPAIMSARFIYCIVPGKTKAQAVHNTLNREINERYPSTIIRKHSNAILFLDIYSNKLS